ncbi:MAG: hypothetical protein ACJ74T_01435 [Pyrinomonadaceae bacterium]
MSSQRMKLKARTLLLLALLLCTARAASAQGSSAAPAPELKPVSIALVMDASTSVGALNKTGEGSPVPEHRQDGFRNFAQLAKASGGAAYRVKKTSEFDSILTSIRAKLRR